MYKVAIVSGPCFERWDFNSPETTGVGGSETAIIEMSRQLANKNYDITVFGDFPIDKFTDLTPSNVIGYKHFDLWPQSAKDESYDIVVAFRNLDCLNVPYRAKLTIAWLQDTAASHNPNRPYLLNKPDHYFVLTHWHLQCIHNAHRIPKHKLFLTSNGVNPERFKASVDKIPGSVFYSSSPDRGLHLLMNAAEDIVKEVPNFKINVCYGFETIDAIMEQRGSKEQKELVKAIKDNLNAPYIKYHGRLNQLALAEVQKSSEAWFYPASFDETSCITGMEAGMAECAILTHPRAGLLQTVGGNGIMATSRDQFVSEAVRLLTDSDYRKFWQDRAYSGMKDYTWENVANQWDGFFKERLGKK